MKNFLDALDECGLMDLGYVGSKFTWFKKFSNGIPMWERLDRVVGTIDWFDNYPATKVMILECSWRIRDVMTLWNQLGEMVKGVHQ